MGNINPTFSGPNPFAAFFSSSFCWLSAWTPQCGQRRAWGLGFSVSLGSKGLLKKNPKRLNPENHHQLHQHWFSVDPHQPIWFLIDSILRINGLLVDVGWCCCSIHMNSPPTINQHQPTTWLFSRVLSTVTTRLTSPSCRCFIPVSGL